MLCYRDKTFCSFYQDCQHGNKCGDALTPEKIEDAKTINLPVCQYRDKPECFKQIKEKL